MTFARRLTPVPAGPPTRSRRALAKPLLPAGGAEADSAGGNARWAAFSGVPWEGTFAGEGLLPDGRRISARAGRTQVAALAAALAVVRVGGGARRPPRAARPLDDEQDAPRRHPRLGPLLTRIITRTCTTLVKSLAGCREGPGTRVPGGRRARGTDGMSGSAPATCTIPDGAPRGARREPDRQEARPRHDHRHRRRDARASVRGGHGRAAVCRRRRAGGQGGVDDARCQWWSRAETARFTGPCAGLDGAPTPLGVIPMGTGNDFARGCGIPLSPRDAARRVLDGRTRRFDLVPRQRAQSTALRD